MKILHTADWHLGKRLDRFERLDEQRLVMAEICDIAEREQVQLVLIAGDLFDTYNPPAQATELFYKTVKRLAADGRRAVVAIAGNHDSADRIAAPDPLARECGILLAGYPDAVVPEFELGSGLRVIKSEPGFAELTLPREAAPVRLLLTPYANEQRLKTFLGMEEAEQTMRELLAERWKTLADKYCDEKGINLLVAHLFFTPASGETVEEPEDEKPVLHVGGAQQLYADSIPPQVQYTALGHLHRCIEIRGGERPVMYSSSPLSYSFSEAEQQKYVMIVEVEPGQPAQVRRVPLHSGRPLKRLKANGLGDALAQLRENQDALIELSLTTETYLNAAETRELHDAHVGIVTIIPYVTQQSGEPAEEAGLIDLQRPMHELFADYFRSKNGDLAPGESLMALFREVQAGSTETEEAP